MFNTPKNLIYRLFLVILLFCNFKSYSQTGFPFSIEIKDEQKYFDTIFVGEAFFVNEYKNSYINESDLIWRNGSYLINGKINYPTAFRVYGEKGNIKFNQLIFVDSGYQSFKIGLVNDAIIFENVVLSRVQNEYNNLFKYLKLTKYEDEINLNYFTDYVQKNTSSYVALYLMIDKIYFGGYKDLWRTAALSFTEEIKQTKVYQYFSNQYFIDKFIYPIKVKNLDGINVIKHFKPKNIDKKLVILFWFANCKPCILEMQSINKKYPFNQFEVISVCTDSFSINSKAKSILKANKIKWQNFWDFKGEKFSEYIKLYAYPSNLVIDVNGKIKGKHFDVNSFN